LLLLPLTVEAELTLLASPLVGALFVSGATITVVGTWTSRPLMTVF
jgi:hypothetical protein